MTAQPTTDKAFAGYLSQSETNYVPLSAVNGKACANCRWFMNDGCFIVASYEPEPIIATGYCDRWEASPAQPESPAEQIAEAVGEAVESAIEAMPMGYVEMERKPKTFRMTPRPHPQSETT